MSEKLTKWRLILGKKSDPAKDAEMDAECEGMDKVLEALYDSERKGGLGSSSPNINRWLGDIRKYFPVPVVQVMQKDALERLGMKRMLMEPELLESIEPDVDLVGTILSLKNVMPTKTKDTARQVVRKVVEALEKRLKQPMIQALKGALNRAVRNRRPKHNEIDWHKTIRANLRNYQKDIGTIIPENLVGYGKKGRSLKRIILLIDESGSMASSVVYAGVFAAVIASLRSVKTHIVAFDTSIVDLTENLDDPVDLLFGIQLGGGTDINKALGYSQNLITNPSDTIVLLISDLFEGGADEPMLQKAAAIKNSGAQLITLLALDDKGAPAYDREIAAKLSAMEIPVFACTPDHFPELLATAVKKESIQNWIARIGIKD